MWSGKVVNFFIEKCAYAHLIAYTQNMSDVQVYSGELQKLLGKKKT